MTWADGRRGVCTRSHLWEGSDCCYLREDGKTCKPLGFIVKPSLMNQNPTNPKKNALRWVQRLDNFKDALSELQEALSLSRERNLTKLEKQGLIQAFEFTHELAWNVMKDYFEYQGATQLVSGSRDATREAFQRGLVQKGDIWMEMIKSRNLTSHTYHQQISEQIVNQIINLYGPEFEKFLVKML